MFDDDPDFIPQKRRIRTADSKTKTVKSTISSSCRENVECAGETNKVRAKIYYATRTHAQIRKVVAELRKTQYRPRMAVLGSREYTCTHPRIRKSHARDMECLKLLDSPKGCSFYERRGKLTSNAKLRNELWDLEDLHQLAQQHKACGYYAARALSKEAELVICPYSYLLDPGSRESIDIVPTDSLTQSVLIFDEAHNIEDACREAATLDITLEDLHNLQNELKTIENSPLCNEFQMITRIVNGVVSWIENTCFPQLQPNGFEQYAKVWRGYEIADMLVNELRVSTATLPMLAANLYAALSANSHQHPSRLLSSAGEILLERLFRIFHNLLVHNQQYAADYRLVLQRILRHTKTKGQQWVEYVGFWCLNPAVAFEYLRNNARSVIVTSGTLTPLTSFSSELNTTFTHILSTNHIINVQRQLRVSAVSWCGSQALTATFKQLDDLRLQDAFGESLLTLLRCIPQGVLCFFPSYGVMERLITRWRQTRLWEDICAVKQPFIEPRFNEEVDDTVASCKFQELIHQYFIANETARGIGQAIHHRSNLKAEEKEVNERETTGGLLCAVCRGKVAEGLDFSDHHARGVIILGIPFPQITDLKIILKKEYNDERHSAGFNVLPGNEWYSLQAFRAVNQALGRCIRHINDYGVIVLLDSRYSHNIAQLSHWLQASVQVNKTVADAVQTLRSFFASINENIAQKP